MMGYIPQRGDIIHLNLNPTKGQEIRGERYAFVYTPWQFNQSGFVGVCPISRGIGDRLAQDDESKLYVSLQNSGSRVDGRIFCHQHRCVDLSQRGAEFVEAAPEVIVEEVMAVLDAIIFDGFYEE